MRVHADLDPQYCYVLYEYISLKSLKNAVFIEQVSFFVEDFSSSENEEMEDPLDTAVGILPEIRFCICYCCGS